MLPKIRGISKKGEIGPNLAIYSRKATNFGLKDGFRRKTGTKFYMNESRSSMRRNYRERDRSPIQMMGISKI